MMWKTTNSKKNKLKRSIKIVRLTQLTLIGYNLSAQEK